MPSIIEGIFLYIILKTCFFNKLILDLITNSCAYGDYTTKKR